MGIFKPIKKVPKTSTSKKNPPKMGIFKPTKKVPKTSTSKKNPQKMGIFKPNPYKKIAPKPSHPLYYFSVEWSVEWSVDWSVDWCKAEQASEALLKLR